MRTICILFFLVLFTFSCSSDDSEDFANCANTSNVTNGFVYGCSTYETQIGRMNMNSSSEFQTVSCMLEFVNLPYDDFSFEDGDKNINIVSIWISVPAENYELQEIPEGTYTLNPSNDDNPETLDIVTLFRVGPGAKVVQSENNSTTLLFKGLEMGQPDSYERAELTIDRLPSGVYEINYLFEAEGKIVKGHYKGTLSFVDNWA